MSGDPTARLFAIGGRAVASVFAGEAGDGRSAVRAYFAEMVKLGELTGEWWIVALAEGFAGASLGAFDPEEGLRSIRRGAEAAERSGSPYARGVVAMAHGRALGRMGDTDGAVVAFGLAIERFMELGDDRFVLATRSDLAHALRRGGRLDQASALYRETIHGWVHLGHRGAVANQLENIAYVDIETGRYERAAHLFGAATAMREAANAAMAFDEEPEFDGYVARLRAELPAPVFDASWAAGRDLSIAASVALAIS